MDVVNVSVKVVAVEPAQVVGKDKWKLANALISDPTETIVLELWENHTEAVEISKTYIMRNVRVRLRSGVKKLGTTKDTIIEETRSELEKVHYETEDGKSRAESLTQSKTIMVDRIEYVQKFETFKKCANCKMKIIHVSAKPTTFCDKCEGTMRSTDCDEGFWAKIVVKLDGKNLALTVYEEILKPFLEGNQPNIDTLTQRLLLNTGKFTITYNSDTNIVSAMACCL